MYQGQDLRVRGVEVSVEGDQLRCRGPRGWQAPELLAGLREHKPAIVRHIRRDADRQVADDPDTVQIFDFSEVVNTAVLVRSRLFGGREVWIALSDEAAAQILSEEQQRDEPRPVLRQTDLKRLDGMSEDLVRAVLNVAAAFPGARILQ